MNKVLTTAPALEPVTLAEVKMHLRLDSSTLADSWATYQSIAPGSQSVAAAYSLKGTGRDVLGKRALVILNSGANGTSGTVDAKIQEADTNSDASYADWTGGGFTQVTEANDNAVQEIEYTGTKQYIRVVATVGTIACSFGASIQVQDATHPEDTLLTALIKAARQYVESFTGRALITQTWTLYLEQFPDCDYIELPYPELQSITSVKYRDSDWAEAADWTTWAATNYIAQTTGFRGRIHLAYGIDWPIFTEYPVDAVEIVQVCGYGAATTDVPENIRLAMLVLIGTWYEFREMIMAGANIQEIPAPFTVNAMLWPYRVEV